MAVLPQCLQGTTNPCPVKVTVDGAEALAFARAWVRAHKEGSGVHAESLIQRRFQAQKAGAHLDALAREVTRAEDRRKNLLNLAADGTLTKLEVRDGLDAIKVELEGAQSNLAFAKRQAAVADLPENHSFGALDAAWERMSPPVLNRGMLEVMDALFIYPFRNQPRMIARGVWEKDKEIPVAETPDLDFSDGRLCLGCHQWKSEDAFYRRTRGAALMSRCKRCKQQEHLAWKERKTASTHAAELGGHDLIELLLVGLVRVLSRHHVPVRGPSGLAVTGFSAHAPALQSVGQRHPLLGV